MSRVFTIAEGLENLGAMKTGGQGSVYKGRRQASVYTAVKLLPTPVLSASDQDKNYRSFQSEVEKLYKVNEQASPYVVKILGSGLTESGSFPFIEMEYIEGPDLSELLQAPHPRVFALREAIKLAEQLASALAHCHKAGVWHGDLKSNNVRYNTRSGNYVLLDFGLALMSREERRTSLRHAGAIEFMAPEQSEGEMLPQTDVYSYGVILYELLAGQVPFPLAGSSEAARNGVMLAHRESPVPDLEALRRGHLPPEWTEAQQMREAQVPGWLSAIVYRCLSKEPAGRYPDGVALQEAVAGGSMAAAEAALSGTVAVPHSAGVTAGEANAAALQAENERLQAAVNQYRQEKIEQEQQRIDNFSTPKVSISRPAFAALIGLLMVCAAYTGYSLFYRPQARPPAAYTGADTVKAAQRPDTGGSIPMESNYDTRRRDTMRKAAADSITNTVEQVEAQQRAQQRSREQAADTASRQQSDTATVPPGNR